MSGLSPPGGTLQTCEDFSRPRRIRVLTPFLLRLLLILPVFTTCDPLGSSGGNATERLCAAPQAVAHHGPALRDILPG